MASILMASVALVVLSPVITAIADLFLWFFTGSTLIEWDFLRVVFVFVLAPFAIPAFAALLVAIGADQA